MNPPNHPDRPSGGPSNRRPLGPPAPPQPQAEDAGNTRIIQPAPHMQPHQQVQPQMKPVKSANPLLWIIVGVVATIVIIGGAVGGYFLYMNYKGADHISRFSSADDDYNFDEEEVDVEVPQVAADPNGETDPRFTDFSWLSEREVSYDDLCDLPSSRLRILRNAIFARHGYIFKSDDLKEYFGRYDWYAPRYADVTAGLSPVEQKNIQTIKRYE